MRDFLLKRVLQAVGVVICISAITFFILNVVPGDPVRVMMGDMADQQTIEQVRHNMGLDKPVAEQYVNWFANMVRGDFGTSYTQNKSVASLMGKAFSVTAVLAGLAYVFALVFGLTIGVVSAVFHGKWVDRLLMAISIFGISAPAFWVAILIQIVFALNLKWFPLSGIKTPAAFVLPTIALGTRYAASIARVTRTSMLDVLGQDFMRTAEAKGLATPTIILVHGLRNALIPIITIAGTQLGEIFTGSILIESVFAIPGMGKLLLDAINARDLPLIEGGVMYIAIICVVAGAAEALTAERTGAPARRASSYWAVSWNIFKKNKLGMACLVVVALLVIVAIVAPVLAPCDPDVQELSNMLAGPSAAHVFGTDEFGRDILSRVIFGCRVSLSVGVVSQAIALVIGFLAGVFAGYFGGKVDAVISFVIQVFSSFPFLLFAIVVMFVMGPGLVNLYVALGLLMWTSTARLVRGDVMRLKGSEYIQSCILSGGKSWRIIMKHLLPNCVSTLIVVSTLGIPNAILSEASLSFLGLGVQPPMSSWGQMISASQPYIQSNTNYSIVPGIAIIVTVMAFNLLGDALRDALDPKMRS